MLTDPERATVWLYSDHGYRVAESNDLGCRAPPPGLLFWKVPTCQNFFQDETSPAAKEAGSTQAGDYQVAAHRNSQQNQEAHQAKPRLGHATGSFALHSLNNLSLARADLIVGFSEKSEIRPVAAVLDNAIATIRMAGSIDNLRRACYPSVRARPAR